MAELQPLAPGNEAQAIWKIVEYPWGPGERIDKPFSLWYRDSPQVEWKKVASFETKAAAEAEIVRRPVYGVYYYA